MDPLTLVNTRRTPQNEPALAEQVKNNAGGFVFQVGEDTRVHRFLTLGTSGGTYYTTERELTKDNTDLILKVARERGIWLVQQIVAVSVAGRAPRQNPAIFALAAVAGLGDDDARKAALGALQLVCRTGSTLFLFAGYVEQFRGWGKGLRRAVGNWYLDPPLRDVAYQAAKYRQRNGWTHRDLLRLSHPETDDPGRRALFDWIVTGEQPGMVAPAVLDGFYRAQATSYPETWARLIEAYGLSWEMLPDAALTEPLVWQALITNGMPQTALIRRLPHLTRLGVLNDSDTLMTVCTQLADPDRLAKARVHPVSVLVALRTYAGGRSLQGTSTWTPKRQIIDALDGAFYNAFRAVEPAGKRTLLALDVSGSMSSPAAGLPISCREASAALALVTMATEPNTTCVGFTGDSWNRSSTQLSELPISPRQRLDDAVRAISDISFGGTDCALPMTWALENRLEFDTFVVMTDNETWAGSIHPHQALQQYREQTGINARLVVVGMTATEFSIADPSDAGMLDVAGMDSAVPNMIADFSRGTI